METDNQVPVEIRRQLLTQEIQTWRNSLYITEVRARVANQVGDKELYQAQLKEAERILRWIDALTKEMSTLSPTFAVADK